jgi:hypothetical protein
MNWTRAKYQSHKIQNACTRVENASETSRKKEKKKKKKKKKKQKPELKISCSTIAPTSVR